MTVGGTDLGELRLGTWWLWGQGMAESRGRGGNSGRTSRFCVWSAPHCRLASVVLDSEVGCGAGAADRPPQPAASGSPVGFRFRGRRSLRPGSFSRGRHQYTSVELRSSLGGNNGQFCILNFYQNIYCIFKFLKTSIKCIGVTLADTMT